MQAPDDLEGAIKRCPYVVPFFTPGNRFAANKDAQARTGAEELARDLDRLGVEVLLRWPQVDFELGVVGLIVPWNFPLNITSWKLGPALACGNTVVLKPAETTPLTALIFTDICRQAGLPAGVANLVLGAGARAGAPLAGARRGHGGACPVLRTQRIPCKLARARGGVHRR